MNVDSMTIKDREFLNKLGVDIFSNERNYWFIRTQDGTYYDDFINDSYVGIEWNKISDLNYIINTAVEDLKVDVAANYPKVDKPGSVVSKLKKFVCDIKKGDIVLIPSKSSEWISIGEFIEDKAYIEDYDDSQAFQEALDSLDDGDTLTSMEIMKKRRRVKWLKSVKKSEIDPYLYSIVYNHSAISEANKYSLYIDRTLSQFYIKGGECYLTLKVNKKSNIPYRDMTNFLYYNNKVIENIGKLIGFSEEELDTLIVKINVQSKGPIQIKDAVAKVLPIGVVMMFLFGGEISINPTEGSLSISSGGVPALIECVKGNNIDNNEEAVSNVTMEEEITELIKKIAAEVRNEKEGGSNEFGDVYERLNEVIPKLEIEVPSVPYIK